MLKPLATVLSALALLGLTACGQEPPADNPPAAEPQAASAPANPPHPVPADADGAVDLSGIPRAEGGQTVAEVYAGTAELEGQTVTVRGKIVKVNAGIMDRNWLHVRDGSGEEGTNDLTVTTLDVLPAVGDMVLVSGPVSLNREFGMGYTYPVIIENAQVTVEAGQ